MDDGTRILAGSGIVDLEAGSDIALSSVTTSGEVQITTFNGAIIDSGDAFIDLTAGAASLRARNGIGTGNSLEIAVATLAASNAADGAIELDSNTPLTIGTVNGLSGVANSSGFGAIHLTAVGGFSVSQAVLSSGPLTLAANDTANPQDDLIVNNAARIASTGSTVTLLAGDGIDLSPGTIVEADGEVSMFVDVDNADPVAGGSVTLSGVINSVSISRLIVVGGGGPDQFVVDSNGALPGGTVNNILSDLELQAGGGDDSFILEDSSSLLSSPIRINKIQNQIFGLGSAAFIYDDDGNQLESLTVHTSNVAADSFQVAPDTATAISIDANGPTSTPGDTLELDLLGVSNPEFITTGPRSGRLRSTSHQTVSFQDIEDTSAVNGQFLPLEVDLRDPSLPGNNGVPDTIIIRRQAAPQNDKLEVVIREGSGPEVVFYVADFNSLSELIVTGSNDDDLLIVDFVNGNPIPGPASLISSGTNLVFNAGEPGTANENDQLRIIGDSGTSVSAGRYTPDSTTFGSGEHLLTLANGETRAITFTGLEPTEVSNIPTYSLVTPNSADELTVDAATGSAGRAALAVTGTSGGVAIESLTVFQVGDLTIDSSEHDATGSGNDRITLQGGLDDGVDLADGLANLTLLFGESGATDADLLRIDAAVDVLGSVLFREAEFVVLNANVEAAMSLTLETVEVGVDVGPGVQLVAEAGDLRASAAGGVASINLVGANGNLFAAGGRIELTQIRDRGAPSQLQVESGTDAVLAGVDIQGALDIKLDTGQEDVSTLTSGDLRAGSISVAGSSALNDTLLFFGLVESRTGNVAVNQASRVAFDDDVTSAADLIVSNVTGEIEIAADLMLSAGATGSGNVVATDNVRRLDFATTSGGSNRVHARGGSVALPDIVDSASGPDDVHILSGTDLTLGAVELDGSNAVRLTLTLDDDADDVAALTAGGPVTAGTIAVTGQGTNDTISFHAAVTSQTGSIIIDSAETIDLDGDVTAATFLTFDNVAGVTASIDLAFGVDLTALNGSVMMIPDAPIHLSGSASTNRVQAFQGSVFIDDVTDLAGLTEFEIQADDSVLIKSIILDNNTSALIDVDVDRDGDGGALSTGTLIAGHVTVNSNSDLVFNNLVRATAADGLVLLSADESAGREDLTLATHAVVEVTGTDGTIELRAGDNLTLSAGARVGDNTVGNFDDRIVIRGDYNSDDTAGAGIEVRSSLIGSTALILGNNQSDILRLTQSTNSQLTLRGDATALSVNPGHTNQAFVSSLLGPQNIGIHFEGNGGTNDRLELGFEDEPREVAFFSDEAAEANSGVVNVRSQFSLSFDGVASLSLASTVGGRLTLDATSTPDTDLLSVDDDPPDPGANRVLGNHGFTETTFSGFQSLLVRGGGGSERITLERIDATDPDGAGGAAALTEVTLSGDDTTGGDSAADSFEVLSLPASTALAILGEGANNSGGAADSITIGNQESDFGVVFDGGLDPIDGPISIQGGLGLDRVNVDDSGNTAARTGTLQHSSLSGLGMAAGIVSYDRVEEVNLILGRGDDFFNVHSTEQGTTYNVDTDALLANGNDTIIVTSDLNPLDAFLGLNGIDGQLNLNTRGGHDSLVVSDSGDGAGDTYVLGYDDGATEIHFGDGAAPIDLRFDVDAASQLEELLLVAGNGDDTITNAATSGGTPLVATMLASRDNSFNTSGGDDRIELAWNGSFRLADTTTLVVDAGPQRTSGRDVVSLLANETGDGERQVAIAYGAAGRGDADVKGLHTGSGTVVVRATEQLNYEGDLEADDQVTVSGTGGDDILSVTPLSATSANVFRGGKPMLVPPNIPADNDPGVEGGSAGPDLNLTGLKTQDVGNGTLSGLWLSGGDGNDRLVVNASTEPEAMANRGSAWTGNIFGSGSAVRPVGTAFDDIQATESLVRIARSDTSGTPLGMLLDVNIETATFSAPVDSQAELTINAGEESSVRASGVADDVTVTLSASFQFQVNGGAPPLPASGQLSGDRLNVTAISGGALNIHNDASAAPSVSMSSTSPSATTQPVSSDNIELLTVQPGTAGGTINVIGDNNGAQPDQPDEIVIIGGDVDSSLVGGDADGANEFLLLLNGSLPIGVHNAAFLNVVGGGGDDDLTLDPWADDTPRGWGIDVTFDGGVGDDDLFYGNVERDPVRQPGIVFVDAAPDGSRAGVSEQVSVVPTTLTGRGQLQVTNVADGGSITTVDFLDTEDFSFFFNDGSAGDRDTLVLHGTAVGDTISADFSLAGDDAGPWVDIDLESTTQLLQIERFAKSTVVPGDVPILSALDGLEIRAGAGDDQLQVTPAVGLDVGLSPLSVEFLGENPTGADTLLVTGTTDGDDLFVVSQEAIGSRGIVEVTPPASATTTIHFIDTSNVEVDGGAGGGKDRLVVSGTGASNVFSLLGTAPATGTVQVDAGPIVAFTALGRAVNGGTSELSLIGFGGDDRFTATHVPDWDIGRVILDGGTLSTADRAEIIGTGSDDAFQFTPTAVDAAELVLESGGSATVYDLVSVEVAAIDALGELTADSLVTLTEGIYEQTPAAEAGSGSISVTVDGKQFLALSYRNIESANFDPTTLVVAATVADDTILVTAAGIVVVNGNPTDASGTGHLRLQLLAGNDQVTIEPGAQFAAGIAIHGGDSDPLGDSVFIQHVAASTTVLDFDDAGATTLAGIVTGKITLDGVELLTLAGSDTGAADDVDVLNYGYATDVRRVTFDTADNDPTPDGDTIDLSLLRVQNTIVYAPLGKNRGRVTRREGGPELNFAGLHDTPTAGQLSVVAGGASDTLIVLGSAGDDLVMTSVGSGGTQIEQWSSGDQQLGVDLQGLEELRIEAGAGDDQLIVDEGNGAEPALLNIPGGIYFSGDSGTNALRLQYSGTGALLSSSYQIGPAADVGSIVHRTAADAQSIFFDGVAPIVDTVSGSLDIKATDADNAVVFSAISAGGLVTIDGFPRVVFDNKTDVVLDTRGGDDRTTLAGTSAGLSGSFTVNSGAGRDTVSFVGTAADDTFVYTPDPLLETAGSVLLSGPKHFTATESVVLHGAEGNDLVTARAANLADADDQLVWMPSDARSGSFQFGSSSRVTYAALEARSFVLGASVDGDSVTVSADDIDNQIEVTAESGFMDVIVDGGPSRFLFDPDDDDRLTIRAAGGADTIVATPSADVAVFVEGGDPAAGDRLNVLTTDADDTVQIDPGAVSVAGLPSLEFSGIEELGLSTFAGRDVIRVSDLTSSGLAEIQLDLGNDIDADELTLLGTAADDQLFVIASGRDTVEITGLSARLMLSQAGPLDLVTFDGRSGSDTLTTRGDTPRVDVSAGRVRETLSGVLDFVDVESLTVEVTGASLTIDNATVYEHVPGIGMDSGQINADGLPIHYTGVDSGEAILLVGAANSASRLRAVGTTSNDAFTAAGDTIQLAGRADLILSEIQSATLAGGASDDVFSVTPTADVAINVVGGSPEPGDQLTVHGNNGDNAIIVAADSVNVDMRTVSFAEISDLRLKAAAGADVITVADLQSAPLRTIEIDLGDDGDSDAILLHGGAGDDRISVTASGGEELDVVGLDARIHVTRARLHDELEVDGGHGADTLVTSGATPAIDTVMKQVIGTVNGTLRFTDVEAIAVQVTGDTLSIGGSTIYEHTPGATNSEGTLVADDLPVHYRGVGAGKTISVAGPPSGAILRARGTDEGNQIAVSQQRIAMPSRADLLLSDIREVVVTAFGGSDSITVQPAEGLTLSIDGGGGTDTLIVDGSDDRDQLQVHESSVVVDAFPEVAFVDIAALHIRTFTGADTVMISDLTFSDLNLIRLDVGDDGDSDTVAFSGGNTDDHAFVMPGAGERTTVVGLSTRITVDHSRPQDAMVFSGGQGNDTLVTAGQTPSIDIGSHEIQGALPGPLRFAQVEEIVVQVTGGRLDLSGSTSYEHVPDNGRIHAGTFFLEELSIGYTGLDQTGTAFLTSPVGGAESNVVARGTASSDLFDLSSSSIALAGRATLMLSNIDTVRVESLGGNDELRVRPTGSTAFEIDGGDPSSGDRLTYEAASGAAIAVDLGRGTVVQTPLGQTSFSAVEQVVLSAAGNQLTVTGDDSDEIWSYLPTGPETGILTSQSGPEMAFSDLGQLTLAGGGGSDALQVRGTARPDIFTVSEDAVLSQGLQGVDGVTEFESLEVSGGDGSDIFHVTSGAIPIFIDGGHPIGGDGDVLNVASGHTVRFGPQSDEGSLVVDGNQPISYDHIENLGPLSAPGGVTITGSNTADTIAVVARDDSTHVGTDGVRDFTIEVNDRPVLLFTDTAAVQIDAGGGKDDILVRSPAPNDAEWDVAVSVDGGTSSAGDRLVYEAPGAASDRVVYTPSQAATALLDPAGPNNAIEFFARTEGIGGNQLTVRYELGSALAISEAGSDVTILVTPSTTAADVILLTNTSASSTQLFAVARSVATGVATGVVAPAGPVLLSGGGSGSRGRLTIDQKGDGDDNLSVVLDRIEEFIYDAQGSNDRLEVGGFAGTVTYHPGDTTGSGRLAVNGALPIDFQALGAAASLVVTSRGDQDRLQVLGTARDDFFLVTSSTVKLNDQLTISHNLSAGETIQLVADGPAGNDTATVVGTRDSNRNVAEEQGDEIYLDLLAGRLTVTGGTTSYPDVALVGIEHLAVEGGGGLNTADSFTVDELGTGPLLSVRLQAQAGSRLIANGTAVNDTIDVIPSAAGAGAIAVGQPAIHYSGFGGGLTVNGDTGTDTLQILGSPAAESIVGNGSTIAVAGSLVTLGTSLEQLRLLAGGGDDRINLSGLAATIPKTVEGGEGSDIITLVGTGSVPSTSRLSIRGGGSEDILHLVGAANSAESVVIEPDPRGIGTQLVTGLDSPLDVRDVERITYTGADDDDVLQLRPGPGEDTVLLSRAATRDHVATNKLPDIEFSNLAKFVADLDDGNRDSITFVTKNLAGVVDRRYELLSDSSDRLRIEGEDGSDDRFTIHKPDGAIAISHDLAATVIATTDALGDVVVAGGGGRDQFSVAFTSNAAAGSIAVPITIDGSRETDSLEVESDAADITVQATGPASGSLQSSARSTLVFGNIEQVKVTGDGTSQLSLIATNADNQITLRGTSSDSFTASIDDTATMAYSRFATAELEGMGGEDEFDLQVGDLQIERITVHGGGPGQSIDRGDRVTVTGRGTSGPISWRPDRGGGGGDMEVDGQLIELRTVEQVGYDAAGATDELTVHLPESETATTVSFSSPGSGQISLVADGLALPPVAFSNFGVDTLVAQLDFLVPTTHTSQLTLVGSAGSDSFAAETGGRLQLDNGVHTFLSVGATGMEQVTLDGVAGSDQFDVQAGHSFASLTLAGKPGSGSVARISGDGTPLAATLGTPTTVSAGSLGTVGLPGIEELRLDAAGSRLQVMGRAENDDLTYMPLGSDRGTLHDGNSPVEFLFENLAELIVDGAEGDNILRFQGTTGDDEISVGVASIEIAGLQGIDGIVNFSSLRVNGREGSDAFDVVPSDIAISIDGADPIGVADGDRLAVNAGPLVVVLHPGPEDDEGTFVVDGSQPISFDHIEDVGIVEGGTGTGVAGTGRNDAITIIARDATTHPGADGVNDFTVTINGGMEVLWIDQPQFELIGQGGADLFSVVAPSPNPAGAWGVDLKIDGGLPNEADAVIIETPGQTDTSWTPTQTDGGVLELVDLNARITLAHIQQAVYDGQADNDTLTVVGDAAGPGSNDVVVHVPGPTASSGSFQVNNLLPIDYRNVGPVATLRVDGRNGTDRLVRTGTNSDNSFLVGSAGNSTVELTGSLPIQTVNTEQLSLLGLAGDDRFLLDAGTRFAQIDVDGGELASSNDLLEINGRAGVNERFDVVHDQFGAGRAVETISSEVVTFVSLERLQIAGNGTEDSLRLGGTPGDDNLQLARGPHGDQLTGNDQVPVDIAGMFRDLTVDVGGGTGNDTLTVHVTRLGSASSYAVAADPEEIEQLELLGTDVRDLVTATADSITVTEGVNANTIHITPGQLDLIRVLGLAGNDSIELVDFTEPVQIEGGAGHDLVDVSEAATSSVIHGGEGNDVLRGGPQTDFIDGGRGDDLIFGLGAVDRLLGGDGDDFVAGGAGRDHLAGGNGSDTFLWNPGGATDIVSGDDGIDVVQMVGGSVADTFQVRNEGARLRLLRDPESEGVDAAGVEQVDLNTRASLFGKLGGQQVVPPNQTDRSGSALLTYDSLTGSFEVDIQINGIPPTEFTSAEIRLGAAGNNGEPIVDIRDGAWALEENSLHLRAESISFPPEHLSELLSGRTYLNVSTAASPQGLLRAQLAPLATSASLVGADTFQVGDLTASEVQFVNIGLGPNDQNEIDTVTLEGRSVNDEVTFSITDGTLNLAGLSYHVRLGLSVAGDDRLEFLAAEGDDTVTVSDEAALLFAPDGISVMGGDGRDRLSGFGELIGGAGDDLLLGGGSSQVLRGGDGNDELHGGGGNDLLFGGGGDDLLVGDGGDDSLDGGAGFDTIPIAGTSANDVIDVSQTSESVFVHTVNQVVESDMLVPGTVESARVEAGDGDDTIRTTIADELYRHPDLAVQVTIDGSQSGRIGDHLVIVDQGVADLVLYHRLSSSNGAATIGPANPEPFEYAYFDIERTSFVDDQGRVISPDTGDSARLLVFGEDPFELNDDRLLATPLGANQTLSMALTIDPAFAAFGGGFSIPGDSDWFRIVADTTGVLDIRVSFEEIPGIGVRPGLPGNGNLDIELFDTDGTLIAGHGEFGENDGPSEVDLDGDVFAEDERIRIPAVAGRSYYLNVRGATPEVTNSYTVSTINTAAPSPFGMVLLNDSGAVQHGNVTADTTPTVSFRVDDSQLRSDSPAGNPPHDQLIEIPFQPAAGAAGFRVAVFADGPGANSLTPAGFAEEVGGVPGVYVFTFPAELAAGSYDLSARLQIVDPSVPGHTEFGPRSELLELSIDPTAPFVSFGEADLATDGLDPDGGDTGIPGVLESFSDRVTNNTTPTIWGWSEAGALVHLYVDQNDNRTVDGADVLIGSTVAAADVGLNADNVWRVEPTVDLNDPRYFSRDGVRTLLVTAANDAGVVSSADLLEVYLDTSGPVIRAVTVNSPADSYDLFAPDPLAGPTPAVESLILHLGDQPPRDGGDGLNPLVEPSIVAHPGHYRLVGDHHGAIPIESVSLSAESELTLTFFTPLPDDRYTLTVDDAISDRAGNALDGDTNADQPLATPRLPSGDGVPGGQFVARFVVDSRAEIGTACCGLAAIDINGNFEFDPAGGGAANQDIVFRFGGDDDRLFNGNFASATGSPASGFDKLGSYGQAAGIFRFVLDFDHDGVGDFESIPDVQLPGTPLAGDFSAGKSGDEIGLFHVDTANSLVRWYLDSDGDNNLELSDDSVEVNLTTYPEVQQLLATEPAAGERIFPLVGDLDGDGSDDLVLFDAVNNLFHADLDRDGLRDDLLRFGLPGDGERPVAADLNLDGIDDIGLFLAGDSASEAGWWQFLISDEPGAVPSVIFDAYSPAPLGNDLFASFGNAQDQPLLGNFDPPVGASLMVPSPYRNRVDPLDVNRDGEVTSRDVLVVVNAINAHGAGSLPAVLGSDVVYAPPRAYVDVTGDRMLAPADVLLVVNYLNRNTAALAEGETASASGTFWYRPGTLIGTTLAEATAKHPTRSQTAEPESARPLGRTVTARPPHDVEMLSGEDWEELLADIAIDGEQRFAELIDALRH